MDYSDEYDLLSELFRNIQLESGDLEFKQALFKSKCDEMVKKGLIKQSAADMGWKFMELKMMMIGISKTLKKS